MNPRPLRILRSHRSALVGLAILGLFFLLALSIGFLSPYDPATWVAGEEMKSPSADHLLGTDNSGRDIFTRLFFAARLSLWIGVGSVLCSMAIGIPLGALSGYFGGWIDHSISRVMDVLMSFPSILLAICVATPLTQVKSDHFDVRLLAVILSVGVVGIPQFARQVRASVLSLREQEFVQACRALGATHGRILFRSILPNTWGPVIVLATLGVGSSILSAAGLSFLGLGVEADSAEWGAMLHDGYQCWRQSPQLAIFSGLAISLAVLAFNLFGDGLRDALDPRSRP